MPDPSCNLTELAWEACTANCRACGIRARPCPDCRSAARRIIIRLAAADVVPFSTARRILDPVVISPETSA